MDQDVPWRSGESTLPPCCEVTTAWVREHATAASCPDCGEQYGPIDRPALLPASPSVDAPSSRRTSRPGAQPDARISVVHDPSPTGARYSRPAFSDDQVARVVRLLEELQVDVGDERAGGASWGPPSDVAAQRYDRERIQTSVREPSGPNLAVLLEGYSDSRPTVEWTIEQRAGSDATAASVLRWLRANGSRAELARDGRAELTRIYGVLGYLYASVKARARYDADERVRAEAAPVLGRALMQQAMDAWWGS